MKHGLTALACACMLLSGCVTGDRMAWESVPSETGTVPGYENSMRLVRPRQDEFEKMYRAGIITARASSGDGTLDVLALSGGGGGGVFGAGALIGLTRGGERPKYEMVTGVSTGSLIAPFAFLGPEWDDRLEIAYTGGQSEKLLASAGIASLFRVGLFDGAALRQLVDQFVTQEMVDAIAVEARKGRVLLVATTNLDTEEPVYWDMGALAMGGGEDARKLFVDVLVASSSIPGVFPPVMIEVEGEGGRYDEMHVDGGVTVPFFIAPEIVFLTDSAFEGMKGATVSVIVNGQLDTLPRATPPNTVEMVLRSSNLAMMRMARSEILLASNLARRNGMSFKFTYLPRQYPFAGSMDFETGNMRALFDYGARCAEADLLWIKREDLLENNGLPAAPDESGQTSCPAPT